MSVSEPKAQFGRWLGQRGLWCSLHRTSTYTLPLARRALAGRIDDRVVDGGGRVEIEVGEVRQPAAPGSEAGHAHDRVPAKVLLDRQVGLMDRGALKLGSKKTEFGAPARLPAHDLWEGRRGDEVAVGLTVN